MCFLRVEKLEETLTTDALGILWPLLPVFPSVTWGCWDIQISAAFIPLSPRPLCQPRVSQKTYWFPLTF